MYGSVPFVTPAASTLDWLCVTTDGVNVNVASGCATTSAAAALHSLVTFALSMMRTRACMFEGHVTVLVSPAKLEFAQVAIPTYRV